MRFLMLALFVAACGAETAQTPDPAPQPEALSLLDEPLYLLETDSTTEARQLAQLAEAREAWEASPDDVQSWVWLGRRTAYLTRYREAIDIYTRGLREHPDSPHLLRHRGHRYLSVRGFDAAIADLSRAAELTSGQPDEIEPDGQPNDAGIPTSTLQTNIWYHLALAHYFKGNFDEAATAMQQCFDLAANNDMRVAAADWLFMSHSRLGNHDAAEEAVAFVQPEMEILENHSYHRRILMYRGLMNAEELLGDGERLDMATQGYGVGNWYLVQGDTTRATETFRRVLATGYWPAFGYIAAEADLARLGES